MAQFPQELTSRRKEQQTSSPRAPAQAARKGLPEHRAFPTAQGQLSILPLHTRPGPSKRQHQLSASLPMSPGEAQPSGLPSLLGKGGLGPPAEHLLGLGGLGARGEAAQPPYGCLNSGT